MSILSRESCDYIETNSPILNQGTPNSLIDTIHPLWTVLLEDAIYGQDHSAVTHHLEPFIDKVLREETYLIDKLGYDIHDSLPYLLVPPPDRQYYSFDKFNGNFCYLSMHVYLMQKDNVDVWQSREFQIISRYANYIKTLIPILDAVWEQLLPEAHWFE